MRTREELKQLQALPLSVKVAKTKQRIREWVEYFGIDGVHVSFSGGKDSTVLLHICREMYPDIKAIFVDTGLEYPEIREFVKGFDNVEWLRPEKNFRQVIEEYGYPFIGKEVSQAVGETRQKYGQTENLSEFLKNKYKEGEYLTIRELQLLGEYINDGAKSPYNKEKYMFMLDSPYLFSNKCCYVMKKTPAFKYSKRADSHPFIATMATESRLRAANWIKHGCNAFECEHQQSMPMSFWTEQDVLLYIKKNNIEICSVYGDVVEDLSGTEEVEGQLTISDLQGFENMELFDAERLPLKTTGCSRTGCMFCGYGCHLEKPGEGRFERMKETHPKQYDYIMRPKETGGLDYKNVIDWLNENGNLNIRY